MITKTHCLKLKRAGKPDRHVDPAGYNRFMYAMVRLRLNQFRRKMTKKELKERKRVYNQRHREKMRAKK